MAARDPDAVISSQEPSVFALSKRASFASVGTYRLDVPA